MGVAYYIVLDNDEPGFDTFVNGKFLANEDGLGSLCRKLNLRTFEDYTAMSADDLGDLIDEDLDLPEGHDEQWFSAEEGLTWASALHAHIKANPDAVTNAPGCLSDLADYVDVLSKAKALGAKWHLNLDI